MKDWAISILVTKRNPTSTDVRGYVGVTTAENSDEAIGKAMRIAERVYPKVDGWSDHSVRVAETSERCEPESDNLTVID